MDGLGEFLSRQGFKAGVVSKIMARLDEEAYDSDALRQDVPNYSLDIHSDCNVLIMAGNSDLFRSVQRYIYHHTCMRYISNFCLQLSGANLSNAQ